MSQKTMQKSRPAIDVLKKSIELDIAEVVPDSAGELSAKQALRMEKELNKGYPDTQPVARPKLHDNKGD